MEGEVLEEHDLFSGQFKAKCRNCGQVGHKLGTSWAQVGHKLSHCKNCGMNNGGNNGNSQHLYSY